MSVSNLVQYFENLNLPMESKRVRLTRNGASRSMHDRHSSRMKRFITDLTEVKRPSPKNKNGEENTSEKSNTLPRNFKNEKTQSSLKSYVSFSSKKKIHNNLSNPLPTSRHNLNDNNDVECFQEKNQILSEQAQHQQIEKKVEEFGETLKQKRTQTENSRHKLSKLSHLSQYEDSSETSEKSDLPSHHSSDAEDDAENSDDMFGYNNFEENEDDNYVTEAYNREGHELVITTLLITRRTIKQNEIDDNIAKLIHNSDYVFHKNEYENHETENNDEHKSTENAENDTTEGNSNHSSFLYSNYSLSNAHLEDEVFYDEVEVCEPYISIRQVNYGESNDSNIQEEDEPFYENTSNFSICEDVVHVQEDNTLSQLSVPNSDSGKRKKIQYVIEEMIKTEELYISGLATVLEDYKPFVYENCPQDLIGRKIYLFGNIDKIYKNAKKFLDLMKKNCSDPDRLAKTFIDSALTFELYPLYSKNKPTADIYLKQFDPVIKARQEQLDDKLGLASYLLTPIQRLGKYVLLLEQIQKELKKENKPLETISAAINVVRSVMRKGNDYIAIDSIKNSDIDLTSKGSFIMRTLFNILKPRKFVSMVFLFENIIVFTEGTPRTSEQFKYVDSIAMSDLSLGKFEEKLNIFHLTNYTKSKRSLPDATYILEADAPKIKMEWTDKIEKILWSQLQKAKEQQKKIATTDKKHTPKTRALSSSEVSLRKTKTNRTAAKSKSKFYDDRNT